MFPSDFKLPPQVVDSMKFNDFYLYTVQDHFQYTGPENEPTYTAYGFRPKDNIKFKVGGPTENKFYPHRSLVSLLWGMKKAQEYPPLPILTLPIPDYDGYVLTVSRVDGIEEQLFVGKAEKKGMVIESQHAESEKVIIDLRLKIDRYESLFMKLKGLNEMASVVDSTKQNFIKLSDEEVLNRQLKQQMADAESPGPLVNLAASDWSFDTVEKDVKKFEERNKAKKVKKSKFDPEYTENGLKLVQNVTVIDDITKCPRN